MLLTDIHRIADQFEMACVEPQTEVQFFAAAALVARIEDLPVTGATLMLKARAASWCLGDDVDSERRAATADRRLQAQIIGFLATQ